MVDAGDIIQTLGGWSVIGFGRSDISMWRNPLSTKRDFRKKGKETHKGIQALDGALSELSVACKPQDARSAIYMLTAPAKEVNVDIVKEIGDYLKELAGRGHDPERRLSPRKISAKRHADPIQTKRRGKGEALLPRTDGVCSRNKRETAGGRSETESDRRRRKRHTLATMKAVAFT